MWNSLLSKCWLWDMSVWVWLMCRDNLLFEGGIIDIYSHTDETPVRIELWDDEIDSIRFF